MGVVPFFEALAEFDEKLHTAFHVLEIDDFARRVHVAKRYADQARGHAAPSHLNRARIGPGGTRISFNLVGNFQFLGRFEQPIEHLGIDIGAPAENRPAA